MHRFFFGGGYRALWEAEIELPVLDLAQEGGGLIPQKRLGGLQTSVLALRGRDGRQYSFRGTDKDPSAVLPEALRGSFLESIVQDQMAAQHPGGPLAANVIAEAAGVLAVEERLVVMPDDPALGEFRDEFGGMVGSFFEYPTPREEGRAGFHGATEIIDHEELYERLKRSNDDPVATDAFLRARLVDLVLGDFDRHRKQWRWVKLPGDARWQPLPEDRDQAFVRYGGLASRLGRSRVPILQRYGPDYPDIIGLTLHGWEQDRWLLAGHEWEDWQAIAFEIRGRLTDAVLDRAVAALPREYAALDGDRLREDLRGRRDALLQGARRFYQHLATEVDVQTSSAADRVLVEWSEGGRLLVEVRDAKSATPWFSRSFDPAETQEVRLYLRSGDDAVTIRGEQQRIHLRVIAAGGRKTIEDHTGDAAVYDDRGTATIEGSGTEIIREKYVPPPSDAGFVDVEGVPPRDWGSELSLLPLLGYEKDVGLFLGLSAVHTIYGFRKHPWASRYEVKGAFATEAREPWIELSGNFRLENSKLVFGVETQLSGIEVLRFYGFGNETKSEGDDDDFRVNNRELEITGSIARTFAGEQLRLSAGPWLLYSDTEPGDRFIDEVRPFGSTGFGAVGVAAGLVLDTRTSPTEPELLVLPLSDPASGYPTGGVRLQLDARLSPPVWDATSFWGSVSGSIAAYFSPLEDGRLVFALRAGGELTFGDVPYFAAAYLGGGRMFSGSSTVRGLRAQRYGGNASLFGSAEVRLFLLRSKILIPIDLGLLGFGDVGRVFVFGERSHVWHPSFGGGIWFAPLGLTNTISTSIAISEESVVFYIRTAFHF